VRDRGEFAGGECAARFQLSELRECGRVDLVARADVVLDVNKHPLNDCAGLDRRDSNLRHPAIDRRPHRGIGGIEVRRLSHLSPFVGGKLR
jgi:hypothetical protein